MPAKGKKKAATKPGQGSRTAHQQYEIEYRIWTDISNAMYEASARVAEWINEGGEKHDKRIWAAVAGIKAYTTAYVTAEKERVKGTEMEEQRGTRVYEMLTTRAQELSDGLGMNTPQPRTYAETAAQTDEALLYTAEDMTKERKQSVMMLEAYTKEYRGLRDKELAAHEATRKSLATMEREHKQDWKRWKR